MSTKLQEELKNLESLLEYDTAIQYGRVQRIIEIKKELGVYDEPLFNTSGTGLLVTPHTSKAKD